MTIKYNVMKLILNFLVRKIIDEKLTLAKNEINKDISLKFSCQQRLVGPSTRGGANIMTLFWGKTICENRKNKKSSILTLTGQSKQGRSKTLDRECKFYKQE